MRLQSRRKNRFHSRRGGRRQRNFVPLLTFLGLLALLFWTGKMVISPFFSSEKTENASASVEILKGGVDFRFPESQDWTPAYETQKFFAGDRLRTTANGRISLQLLDGDVIFASGATEISIDALEQKSSGKKITEIALQSGQIWTRVSPASDSAKNEFILSTPHAKIQVNGTILDVAVDASQSVIRLTKGSAQVAILDESGEMLSPKISLGVGQKLVASAENAQKFSEQNQEILEIIDPDFIESEWHLQNLEPFNPQEVASIRRKIEISAPRADDTSADLNLQTSDEVGAPVILAPANGARIPASADSVKIEGTAPKNAVQIMVNGYTLTRFLPGDTKWQYFAATRFGTLVAGENKFEVIAITRDGKKSSPASLQIFYEAAAAADPLPAEPKAEAAFKSPVVLFPPVIDPAAGYQTAAPVVTIKGLVDPATNAVEVNGFRLEKFQPGQTEFAYIANANYQNMREGENIYQIKAFGPDGVSSETSVKIYYSPIKIP